MSALESNQAAVLYGVNDLRVQPHTVDLTLMKPTDVLVQVQAVGICGSDVHYLRKGCCGTFSLDEPMVIGHESGGVVVDVGSEVSHLKAGDVVALEPGVSCGSCSFCNAGKYNLCPDMAFFATPPVHGSLANHIIHPSHLCFKVPENLNVEHAALCEPLSIGIHACRRACIGDGSLEGGRPDRILVLGCGPIGFVVVAVAVALGVQEVVVTDFTDSRIKFIKQQFPDIAVSGLNIRKKTPQQVSQDVKIKLKGESPDAVFDCAGFNSSMLTALEAVRSGGKVVLVGCGDNEMTLPLTAASQREVDVFGLFRYRDTYPFAIELMSKGKVELMPMVTHRFGFTQDDVMAGFEVAGSGREGAIKVLFRLDGGKKAKL